MFKATRDVPTFMGGAVMLGTFLKLSQSLAQPAMEPEYMACALPELLMGGATTALLHSSLGQQSGACGFGVISSRGLQMHLPLRDLLAGFENFRIATGHVLASATL
ncbi:MAG: hypothetical protein H7273_01515 [Polaromonas sp.]|nr:hypothetical protein [Polaromonas sp.]